MSKSSTGPLMLARRSVNAIAVHKMLNGSAPDSGQRETLKGWSGWGPLAHAFDYNVEASWQDVREHLEEMLSPDENRLATQSVDTAFYTSSTVVAAVFDLLKGMGFTGGRVGEFGCGSGAFIDGAPADLPIDWTGVEIDPISAGIAQVLHPDAAIINKPLEQVVFRLGAFDAVVGNVPFAPKGTVYDPLWPGDEVGFNPSLHAYFIWRALNAVRPGGVVALITSRYTMDSENDQDRDYFSTLADFVGAVRLPTGAFADQGTNVVADLVVWRVRHDLDPALDAPRDAWIDAEQDRSLLTAVNRYWRDNPRHVLGRMQAKGGARTGMTLDVIPPSEEAVPGLLAATVRDVAAEAVRSGLGWIPRDDDDDEMVVVTQCAEKEGSHHLHDDGSVTRVTDGVHVPLPKAPAELKQLIMLRDAALALFGLEADPDLAAKEITPQREHTRAMYEAYVARYGPVHRSTLREGKPDPETGLATLRRTRPSLGGFRHDPDFHAVLGLATWEDETGTEVPSPILLQRINGRVKRKSHTDDPIEAIALCVDQVGKFDLTHAAGLLGISEFEAIAVFGDGGHAYKNPKSQEWESASDYLSGNVRQKLREARAAAETDPYYTPNVTALEGVQPTDLGPAEILARLGAPWIPTPYIQLFILQLLGEKDRYYSGDTDYVDIKHEPVTGSWEVRANTVLRRRVQCSTTYGTERCNAVDLIQHALNGSAPVVKDEVDVPDGRGGTKTVKVRNEVETQLADDRLQKIQEEFGSWLWSEPKRSDALVKLYNERFNSDRLRVFSGKGLTFPGMAIDFQPYSHQLDMVARCIQSKAALCGYHMGAGKSKIKYMLAMKLRELGLAKKPLITVPNHVLEQHCAEGRLLFPGAKILMVTQDDLTKPRRKAFCAKVAAGDWDAVVMTHEQFTAIPVSPRVEIEWLNDQIELLTSAVNDPTLKESRTSKRIAKTLKRMRARHAELTHNKNRDDGFCFDKLGFDYVMVDESQFFKNLFAVTRMDGFSMPGSKRAEDLFLKMTWLRRHNKNGMCGTLFSGTPISNTMAEAYTLLRYIYPEVLLARGLQSFDAFAGAYIIYKTKIEVAPDGSGFRMHRRPGQFVNVPELRMMINARADIRTRAQLNLSGPASVIRTSLLTSPPPEMGPFVERLVARAEKIRQGGVDPKDDNMLAVCTAGRKASLDLRLCGIIPGAPDKIDDLIANVSRLYHEHKSDVFPGKDGSLFDLEASDGALQLVFCDLGTPSDEEIWSEDGGVALDERRVYGRILDGLLKAGVPRELIAFGHDAKTVEDKKQAYARCNDGRTQIYITSSAKGGTGVNIQTRLRVIHHVDPTWRPDVMAQRDGRGDRPGNQCDELLIVRYLTENSFDPYMWQLLEMKAWYIFQLLSGDPNVRVVEDITSEEVLDFGRLKAISTGQELLMTLAELDAEVARLRNEATAHTCNQARLSMGLNHHETGGRVASRRAEAFQSVAALAALDHPRVLEGYRAPGGEVPEKEAAAYLARRGREARSEKRHAHCGVWRGVTVGLEVKWFGGDPVLRISLSEGYSRNIAHYQTSTKALKKGNEALLLQAVNRAINQAAGDAAQAQLDAERHRAQAAEIAPHIGQPFEGAEALRAALGRREEVRQQIAKEVAAPIQGEPLALAAA